MGAWDCGLLDNDTALDGLGDLTDGIRDEVLSAVDSGRAAAGVGLLLQLSAFDFSSENARADELLAVIRSVDLKPLSKEAQTLMAAIAAGGGASLAARPATLNPELAKLLHVSGKSGFGERQAALFETRSGRALVQEVATHCLEQLEDELTDEDISSDLCREASSMGALGGAAGARASEAAGPEADQLAPARR